MVELWRRTPSRACSSATTSPSASPSSAPIYQHEFLYPLLQGYDSVALECDVELGGTDQLFNLLVGRDLMPRYGKRAQMVMTTPLLEGTDAHVENGKVVGKKMSKSADNYVGIDEPPFEMLRKLMLVDDDVIFRYFELLSSALERGDRRAPRRGRRRARSVVEVKELFAQEIVTRFHSAEAAEAALARRRARRRGRPARRRSRSSSSRPTATPSGSPRRSRSRASPSRAARASASSKGGAVHVDGEVVKDEKAKLLKGQALPPPRRLEEPPLPSRHRHVT